MISKQEIEKIVESVHHDPFEVLGAHKVKAGGKDAVAVRAFLPETKEASVLRADTGQAFLMNRVHAEGFFEAIIKGAAEVFPYRLKVVLHDGTTREFVDPYSFLPVLTEFDLYLMAEGTHYRKYEKLGAHMMAIDGTPGVFFAVWAPNALRISVIGDFNGWDGRCHPMRVRG